MNASASREARDGRRPRSETAARRVTEILVALGTGCGLRFGPLPFWAVLTMKWAPWVMRETFSAQRTSEIVQFSWVSLVKKPRICETPTALSARAVYPAEFASE